MKRSAIPTILKSLLSRSTLRKAAVKLRYGRRVRFERFGRVRLGPGTEIVVESETRPATLRFQGAFTCRRLVSFRIRDAAVTIGPGVFFNNLVSLNALQEITIGRHVMIGENVKIYDHDHLRNPTGRIGGRDFITAPVRIGDHVWIGSNCVILRGSTIGDGAVIGAGTVIKGDIPPNTQVYARQNRVLIPLDPPRPESEA